MAAKIVEGSEVWVATDSSKLWLEGTVLAPTEGSRAIVDVKGQGTSSCVVYLRNPQVEEDMTALWHIHEPAILYNLEQRSWKNKAYTFMGPVLVAVNPLKPLEDPKDVLGTPKAVEHPHPWAIAETAYQQLKFATSNRNATPDQIVNQSVVVGGESGAGKTESSKMVLRHLVERCGGGGIDKQLLSSNPILEAFGNASTLRNANSSRFGKFMKLHFDGKAKKIVLASIETYLLERSRITSHEVGERGYHIFYQFVEGAPKSLKNNLGITGQAFAFLEPSEHAPAATAQRSNGGGSPRHRKNKSSANSLASDITPQEVPAAVRKRDKENFKELENAFEQVGIDSSEREELYRLIAAVMHLGNITFEDVEKTSGSVATIRTGKHDATKWAAGLLGLAKKSLAGLFIEKAMQVGGESLTSFRDAAGAMYSRDAVAKAIYSRLFDYILKRINASFAAKKKGKSAEELNFIGVLDIFGFETFKRNDFEQLLINYTNEALQGTFNSQVFEAEAALYKKEGLVMQANERIAPPPDNKQGLLLLNNILKDIDEEGKLPVARDVTLNSKFHKQYAKHPNFRKVHPRDKEYVFSVLHYAGAVSYTVGSFLLKNSDRLPNEVDAIFEQSESKLLKKLWGSDGSKAGKVSSSLVRSLRGKMNGSIVGKFKGQILKLVETLNSTRCSFIRCVKPNSRMERHDKKTWFDRIYVSMQLKCLSIPQTAEVLKSGLPTRIPYATLVKSYKSVIPKESLRSWKTLGGASEIGFVGALFWAFGIDRKDYKLGITRVFFRSGMLATLDKVLNAAKEWSSDDGKKKKGKNKEKEEVIRKFRQYHARRRWRVILAKQISLNKMNRLYLRLQARSNAGERLVGFVRMIQARSYFLKMRKAVVFLQAQQRGRTARKTYEKLQAENLARIRKEKKKAREEKKKADARKAQAKRDKEKLEQEERELAAQLEKEKDKAAKEKLKKQREKAKEKVKKASEEAQLADLELDRIVADADRAEKEEENAEKKNKKHKDREAKRKKHKEQRAQEVLEKQDKAYRKKESEKFEKMVAKRASMARSLNILRDSMRVAEVEVLEDVNLEPLRIKAEKLPLKKGINEFFSRWKTRFFEYDRKEQTITYFKSEADDKPQGVFRLVKKEDVKEIESNSNSNSKNKLMHKMSFKSTNPRRIRKMTDFKRRSHVLEIGLGYADGDTEARRMYMSFPTLSDLEGWARVLQDSESGYKKLPSRIKSKKNLKDLDTNGSAIPNLSSEKIKRLVDIERLQREGKITQEAHDKLLPSVLEDYDDSPQNGIAPDEDVLVECSDASCGATTSTAAEVNCRECGAKLIVRNLVDVDPDPPEGHPALCSLPLDGGLFSVYYMGYNEVLDYYGMTHILYVVVCRWEKENEPVSQWICSYWYSGYRTLRKRLKDELDERYGNIDVTSEDGVANGDSRAMLPKLPKRKTIQTADGINAINLDCSYRTKYLSIFLAHILDMDIARERDERGNSVLLTLRQVDAFFEISSNIYDQGSSTGDEGDDEYSENDDEFGERDDKIEEYDDTSAVQHLDGESEEEEEPPSKREKGGKKKKKKSSKKAKSSSPTSSGKDNNKKKGKKKKDRRRKKKFKETKKGEEPLCGGDFDAVKTALETVTRLMKKNKPEKRGEIVELIDFIQENSRRLELTASSQYFYEDPTHESQHSKYQEECQELLKLWQKVQMEAQQYEETDNEWM